MPNGEKSLQLNTREKKSIPEKNELLQKMEKIFVGFENDPVGQRQFFGSLSKQSIDQKQQKEPTYLFHTTNEQHRKLRETDQQESKKPIHWAYEFWTSINFLNRIIEKIPIQIDLPFLKEKLKEYPDLFCPAICIAKRADVLKEIQNGKRNEIQKQIMAEEIMITTGDLPEATMIIIRTSKELKELLEFLGKKIGVDFQGMTMIYNSRFQMLELIEKVKEVAQEM